MFYIKNIPLKLFLGGFDRKKHSMTDIFRCRQEDKPIITYKIIYNIFLNGRIYPSHPQKIHKP